MSRRITPPQALIFSFAGLIGLGWLALLLPGMSASGGLSWVDALFTATSAVCVTGLIVVDTGTALALPGQVVVLALIQLGGLGIMTFSVFFFSLVAGKGSLRGELAVRSSFSQLPGQNVRSLVRSVILFTLTLEALGAVFLFFFWAPSHSSARAAYAAVFHAVSAFCNAGFSLWADSVTQYRTHLGVNLVFYGLIVAGGLGFIVLKELSQLRQRPFRLSLHSKVVLWTSLALIAAGGASFMLLEQNNVLRGLALPDKLLVSFFQSVTPRTAGFNTVDFSHLTNTTLLVTIFLMFVGGSPGSTAGGIKTVTLALLVALGISRYRGYPRVSLFRRSVPDEIVSRGLTVSLVALSVVVLALGLLLSTETGHLAHPQTRDVFLKLLFETVSAFGTVGLSMGATAGLTVWGKLIIVGTMFVGRVGPLTVALALLGRARRERAYHYGSEEVMVG